MPFGKKYIYNPIPDRLGMLLVSYQNQGKTSFASQMVKPGKAGVVVDADHRFREVVRQNSNFYPLSDEPSDMMNPKRIYEIMHQSMPDELVSLVLIDSVTNIIEGIILKIQDDIATGKSKGARGYKEKADAMKWLQAAVNPWAIDVIWVYHYRDFTDTSGNQKTGTSLSKLELARLWRNINIQCEIVVSDTGKRGVKVLAARGGRTGMIIWDDSGTWENIRERLLKEVWGGLSREEHEKLLEKTDENLFSSSAEAVAWAVEQGAFNDVEDENGRVSKATNSLKKLFKELKAELGQDFSEQVLYAAWVDKVQEKLSGQNSE